MPNALTLLLKGRIHVHVPVCVRGRTHVQVYVRLENKLNVTLVHLLVCQKSIFLALFQIHSELLGKNPQVTSQNP